MSTMNNDASSIPVPLSVGDVMATTSRTLGVHLNEVFLLTSAIAIPSTFLGIAIQFAQYYAATSAPLGSVESAMRSLVVSLGSIPLVIVSWLAAVVVQGAILHLTLESLEGRTATLRESLRAVRPRYFALVFTTLLVGIITVIGIFLCIIPGFIALTFLAIAAPVCFRESLGPIDSLQRSIELTEGHRWAVFAIYLLLVVGFGTLLCCAISPSLVPLVQQTQESIQHGAMSAQNPLTPMSLLSSFLSMCLQIVMSAFSTIIPGVIYARLRGLRDNVDAQKVAQVFV